jgi:threonine dehydrogenase-like Zn-dependent dehydrogenase
VASRLEFAKSYVATHVFQPAERGEDEPSITYSKRNATEMKKRLDIEDRGIKAIDLVIDASGAEVSIQTALYIAKTGGTFVQVRVHLFDPARHHQTYPRSAWVIRRLRSISAKLLRGSLLSKVHSDMVYVSHIQSLAHAHDLRHSEFPP